MIHTSRFLLGLAILAAGACGGIALGAAPASAAPSPSAPQPYDLSNPRQAADLLAGLGSDGYTQRQAAQKRLEAVPFSQIEIVRRLEAQSSDPEIKARLQARIDAMEPEAALNPPPIALDVDHAALSDVAAALAKATGTPINLEDRIHGAARFTLYVKDRAFWDVIDDLRRQNPIRVISEPGQPAVSWDDLPRNDLGRAASQSPDHAGGICLRMGVAYGGLGTPVLKLTVGVDPRIKGTLSVNINSVKDDSGHEKSLQALADSGVLYYAWKWDEPPQANGLIKSLSVAGKLTMIVTLHEERVVVDHPETRLNESIPVGGRYGKIAGFAVSAPDADGKRTLKIAVGLGAPQPAVAPKLRAAPAHRLGEDDGVRFDVVDGKGNVLWTGSHSKMMELAYTSGTVTAVMQEPIRLILSAPVTRESVIPFEFRNLPMK